MYVLSSQVGLVHMYEVDNAGLWGIKGELAGTDGGEELVYRSDSPPVLKTGGEGSAGMSECGYVT